MDRRAISSYLYMTNDPCQLGMRGVRHLLILMCLFSCTYACEDQDPPIPVNTANIERPTEADESLPSTWREALSVLQESLANSLTGDPSKAREVLTLLKRLAEKYPMLAPDLHLKRASILFSLGQYERGQKIAQGLWQSGELIEREARLLAAANSPKCSDLEEALETNLLDHDIRALILKLRRDLQCRSLQGRLNSELELARKAPQLFTRAKRYELFESLSLEKLKQLALAWEKQRAPQAAVELLRDYLTTKTISEEDRWSLSFEAERIQITRLREGYKTSIKKIKRLTKAKKNRGREASLLLAKAYSKAGKERKAQAVYRSLIREWEHSPEAKTATFNLAFSLYERGQYRLARERFASLCRHRGEVKVLSRYPQRSKSTETNNAEWYFAWSLYLSSPQQAAPFLEALIGQGAPVSSQGRRAAYWAAKAYAGHDPEKAAKLREALLNTHYGDWYSLLLRAQDPSLAVDHRAWPLMPPLPKANYLIDEQSGQAPHPSLDPRPHQALPHQSSLHQELELLAMRRSLSITFGHTELTKSLDKRLIKIVKRELDEQEGSSPWGIEVEQYNSLHRWHLSRSPSKRREVPSTDDHKWWRSVFPLAYESEIQLASSSTGIEEEVILSFIYKESAFSPRAISHAYAMGLMQLLEKTALALHPERPPPHLLNPAENIQLGAEYLAALSKRYHDQLPLIAAGYNAGPKNLNSWLQRASQQPEEKRLDLFVERIPFKEAREYVKRLTSIHCTYQYLYGQQSINTCASHLPLSLNLSIEPGVEF